MVKEAALQEGLPQIEGMANAADNPAVIHH